MPYALATASPQILLLIGFSAGVVSAGAIAFCAFATARRR